MSNDTKPPSPILVLFGNNAPDTIAVDQVENLDLSALKIPDEAITVQFVTPVENGPYRDLSPFYYLGLKPEFGTFEEMAARHNKISPEWRTFWQDKGAQGVGFISWDFEHDGVRETSDMLIPLLDGIVLLDRQTLNQVWPKVQPEPDPT